MGSACTVTKQANGDVNVVIRQFSDVKGVAATLIIKPSAIPSGSGLAFMDVPANGSGRSVIDVAGRQWLGFDATGGRDVYVYVGAASQICPIP